jgi:hypothetical protein
MTYSTQAKQGSASDTISESLYDRPKSPQSLNDIKAVEISFEEHEIFAGDRAIAKIILTDEDFETQPWIVIVNGIEIHRGNTWMKCFHFITWHFTQGTLPQQQEEVTAAKKERVAIPVFIPQQKSKQFADTTNLVQKIYVKLLDVLQLSTQHLLLLLKTLEKASGKESMRT